MTDKTAAGTIAMLACPKASTNVKEIGHCPVQNKLRIRFHNGNVYEYENVPRDIYDDMLKSESIGSFIAKNVRGQFKHSKVDDESAT